MRGDAWNDERGKRRGEILLCYTELRGDLKGVLGGGVVGFGKEQV